MSGNRMGGERVIASNRKGRRDTSEDRVVPLFDRGGAAVQNGAGRFHDSAECFDQRLMTEADAEERNPPRRHPAGIDVGFNVIDRD